MARTSLVPVFEQQACHSTELARVVRDNDQAVRQGNGRDLQVIGADGRPGSLKRGSNLRVGLSGAVIERQRDELIEELALTLLRDYRLPTFLLTIETVPL
ncbi:MAG: hypothetical protein KatS3mg051_1104 [Anaerolineae bacterium]|nr:MAG: hypothetical protein KatS3mg051_1104 [Anaerolineae bacterium]